jgi:hypothetical protein
VVGPGAGAHAAIPGRLREFLPLLGERVPDAAGLDAWFSERYLPWFEAAWACYPDVVSCLQALAGQARPPRRDVIAATRAGLAGMWLDRGVDPFTGKAPDQARAVAADLAVARIEDLAELAAALSPG